MMVYVSEARWSAAAVHEVHCRTAGMGAAVSSVVVQPQHVVSQSDDSPLASGSAHAVCCDCCTLHCFLQQHCSGQGA